MTQHRPHPSTSRRERSRPSRGRAPSPGAPTFESGPLARPDEELVDQGLGFDVATVLDRRQLAPGVRRRRGRGRPGGLRRR